MKKLIALLLAVILCVGLCACENSEQKKIEKQLVGSWSSGLSDKAISDGPIHYLQWLYTFNNAGEVEAVMSIIIPFADTIPRGMAKGNYEVQDDSILITWNEVDNGEDITTIWEVGSTESLTYTYEDGVLCLYATDGSVLEQ